MPASEPAISLAAERERLASAVQEAGALALTFFRKEFKRWTKGEGDSPVTEADIAANELLHARLSGPGYGWLSEESENDPARLNAPRVWVVDPIDGTRGYIAGREDWSVSVALVEDGRPVLAALFAPATSEMFLATAGGGATRNGAPMQVSAGNSLVDARAAGPMRRLDALAKRVPSIQKMPRVHSLALRIARVATGELDATLVGPSSHDWDLAAADLLVHEAGGIVTALDGQPLIYNRPDPVHSVLAATGRERHAMLIELMRADASELG